MDLYSKHFLNSKHSWVNYPVHWLKSLALQGVLGLWMMSGMSALSYAQTTSEFTMEDPSKDIVIIEQSGGTTAGGLAPGESRGGVIDMLYVTAPPNWSYIVEKQAGSFVDCGNGTDFRATDKNGRDSAALTCGVTLTETLVIPAASQSARLIVHY